MSDGSLKLTASADFNRLENELDSLKKKHAQLEDQMGKTGKAARGMEATHAKSYDAIAARVQSTITTYMGLSKAVEMVTNAMAEQIALNEKAAMLSANTATAKRIVAQQMGPFSLDQKEEYFDRIAEIGLKHGIEEAPAILSTEKALSATSGDPVDRINRVAEAFDSLAPLFVSNIDQVGPIMGSMLDLQRNIGGPAKEVTAFLLNALSETRLEGAQDLPTLIRAISGAQAITHAKDPKQAAIDVTAMVGAFQAMTGDVEGRVSTTAITNMLAVMSEESKLRDIQPHSLLQAIVEDEDLASQVAQKVLGEGFSKPVQRDFLIDGKLKDLYEAQRKSFQKVSSDHLTGIQEFYSQDPDIAFDTARRKQVARSEKVLKESQYDDGTIRKMLYDSERGAISTSGGSFMDRIASRLSQLEFDYGPGDKFDVADRELSQRVFYHHMKGLWGGSIPFAPMIASGFAPFTGNDPLSLQSKDPEVLRLQEDLRALRELREIMQSQREIMQTQSQDTKRSADILEKIERSNTRNSSSPVRISPGKYQEN